MPTGFVKSLRRLISRPLLAGIFSEELFELNPIIFNVFWHIFSKSTKLSLLVRSNTIHIPLESGYLFIHLLIHSSLQRKCSEVAAIHKNEWWKWPNEPLCQQRKMTWLPNLLSKKHFDTFSTGAHNFVSWETSGSTFLPLVIQRQYCDNLLWSLAYCIPVDLPC